MWRRVRSPARPAFLSRWRSMVRPVRPACLRGKQIGRAQGSLTRASWSLLFGHPRYWHIAKRNANQTQVHEQDRANKQPQRQHVCALEQHPQPLGRQQLRTPRRIGGDLPHSIKRRAKPVLQLCQPLRKHDSPRVPCQQGGRRNYVLIANDGGSRVSVPLCHAERSVAHNFGTQGAKR